jgi:hypothetical protein
MYAAFSFASIDAFAVAPAIDAHFPEAVMPKPAASRLAFAGFIALALFLPLPAVAGWPADPMVNAPVCTVTGSQLMPVTVSDGANGAITTWVDTRAGADYAIYAQRISVDGAPLWTAGGVALCTAALMKGAPAITSDGAGGAIVTWQDWRNGTDWNIYAQRISAAGTVQWTVDGEALCTAPDNQYNASLVTDGAGGAIVAWTDGRLDSSHSTNHDIYAQRISAGGVIQWAVDGVGLCTLTSDQLKPALVPDGAGGAIVCWQDWRSGQANMMSAADLYAQRVSAGGAVQWAADGLPVCTAADGQIQQAIVPDGAGGAIVTWQDSRSGTFEDLYAQRISASGAPQWTGDGVVVCPSSAGKWFPSAAADGAGGVVVAWWENRFGTYDIYAQRLTDTGARAWLSSGVVVCNYYEDQRYPAIVSDGANGAIVTWQDGRSGVDDDIYAQRISAAGAEMWTTGGVLLSGAPLPQNLPSIATDGLNGAIVAWADDRNIATTGTDIYAQRVFADGSTPVLLSLVGADVTADGIHLTWFAGGNESAVATVYRSAAGDGWTRIGEVQTDGSGYLRYTDAIGAATGRLGYRLGITGPGGEAFQGETWLELPALAFALDPMRPNPSSGGALAVSFTLAGGAPASLELLDVTGRRVAEREVGSLGAGRHAIGLGGGSHVAPGLYLVRLTQGTNVRTVRAVVLQ